ncbi:MAG: hypothetical protein R3324_11775 [Halobacteriales archaeon]|nr:hypothetical protein [Halobacteriales archaeon]
MTLTPRDVKSRAGLSPQLRDMLDGGAGEPQAVFASTATVAYTDTTAKDLFDLPANAVIVGILVDVTTAFDDTGTDLLDIGKTGTADHFKDDLDVSSAGQTVNGWSNLGDVGTSPVTVTATFTGSNADAAAGAATVTFLWVAS